MMTETWWNRPRKVSVLVDNDSWILPYAERLVAGLEAGGDTARLCRTQAELMSGGVAFFLGCLNIVKPDVLSQNLRNLVVHASDLPRGRGFSPWTWRVLEGATRLPVCLIEAAEEVDAGAIVYQSEIEMSGTELVEDLRRLIGEMTVHLCQRFLFEPEPVPGMPQAGDASYYRRRTPEDSELDVEATLKSQFDLLRTVDNDHYPAYFRMKGATYKLTIERTADGEDS